MEQIGQKLSVDHIVPFRLTVIYAQTDGLDPNDIRNLATLCRSCHGKKTHAERRLLRGDLIGFLTVMRVVLPAERLDTALALWGLGHSKANLLPFEPIPVFLSQKKELKAS